MKNMNTGSIIVVLVLVVMMLIPVGAIGAFQTNMTSPLDIRDVRSISSSQSYDYIQVPLVGPDTISQLKAQGYDVMDDSGWAAIVKVPTNGMASIKSKMNTLGLPELNKVNFMESGYSIDIRKEVELSSEWKAESTDECIVQFIAPMRESWVYSIQSIAPIQRYVGDNAVVMKLNDAQKAALGELPYVHWFGTYEPAFKVAKELRESHGLVPVKAFAYTDVDLNQLATNLAALGATNIEIRNDWENSISFVIDASKLPTVAGYDSVKLVSKNMKMVPYGEVSGEIVRAHNVWSQSKSNLPMQITGRGQVIHIQDDRLDTTHWDFTKGPLGNRIVYAESSTDTSDHGTAVTGIAAGNGYDMEGWLGLNNTNRDYYELASSNPLGQPDRAGFAGRAPEVNISFGAGLSSTGWSTGYTNGARIFSNSWGPGTVAPGYDGTGDSFMVSNPDALVFFGVGQDGPNQITAGGGGNGKMVISIGASENHRPNLFDSEDDPNQIADFSSRGPVSSTDLRIKPDLMEVGTAIYCTKGDWTSNDASTIYKGSDVDSSLLVDEDGDGVGDYENYQGTSMATPAAAGDAILVRQWLADVEGNSDPEPMLIKALLINGATDMGYGFPSYDQGWGRVNVENAIAPPLTEDE